MLSKLLQFLTGNGTGAVNVVSAAAASAANKQEKKETPLSPIIEHWRSIGSSAGSAARDAVGLTGNRSLQGAAGGAVTAGVGAGMLAGGAATGNALLIGAGLSSLLQGSREAGESLKNLSKVTVEQNRELGRYNGQLAFANAQLEYGRTIREIELARSTGGTAAEAARARNKFEKDTAWIWEMEALIRNRLSEASSKEMGRISKDFERTFGDQFAGMFGVNPLKRLKEWLKGDDAPPEGSPTLQLLRSIVEEGERRRLISDADRRNEAEKTRREMTRPKPSLDPPR